MKTFKERLKETEIELKKMNKTIYEDKSEEFKNKAKITIELFNHSKNKDELNQISAKLKNISQRLNNTIESEKIMQAAEDERQRIAMDIHDQFLTKITQLRRELNTSKIKGKQEKNPKRESKTIDSKLEKKNKN